jgi:hypothetical protein
MPLRQYFAWVGGLLLVGLFAADWLFPAPVHAPRSEIPPNETVNLRIRSDQKWPERVVIDAGRRARDAPFMRSASR